MKTLKAHLSIAAWLPLDLAVFLAVWFAVALFPEDRMLRKHQLVARRNVKYGLIHGAALALAAYCGLTRQPGYEGFVLSSWRWLAVIHLALAERERRANALALGYSNYRSPYGDHVLVGGRWALVPAGGAKTHVGQVSPLYYKKVAGGLPVLMDMSVFPGNIFFVDSGDGTSSAGFGTHPDTPFAGLDFAIGQCTASQGDVIFALPGHNEGLGNGDTIDLDVQGVAVLGIGRGPDRPRIDYDHAAGTWDVGASACQIKNILFLPSVATVTIGVDIETTFTDTLLEDLEAVPGEAGDGTDEFETWIEAKLTTTRTIMKGILYSHHASANGATEAIHVNGVIDRCRIREFWIEISGAAAVAGIVGTGNSTRNLIEEGVITTDAEPGIEFAAGATGMIRRVTIFADLATIDAATVAAGMAHDDVMYIEVGNEANAQVKTPSVDD